jgi:ABC-type bacteriocin/lantibiotic exporter with double-glycine peptidase domain
MKNTSLMIMMDQLNIYCAIAVLGFGGYMVSKEQMTIGDLVAFYTYLGLFFGPIVSMTNMASAVSDGTVSAERLTKLLDAVPDIKEIPNPKPARTRKGP